MYPYLEPINFMRGKYFMLKERFLAMKKKENSRKRKKTIEFSPGIEG